MFRSNPRRGRRAATLGTLFRLEVLEDRLAPSATELSSLQVDPSLYDPARILVRFRPDEDAPAALAGTKVGAALPLVDDLYAVDLAEGVSVEEALAAYLADDRVLAAEPDYRVWVDRTPNDTSFGSQWALHNIGQSGGKVDADLDGPEAWDVTVGSGSVVVAVIDTGIDYTHPDLAANMWVNSDEVAGNGQDDDGNGYVDDRYGYDFAYNDANPMDGDGHGTHVAGTIGAVSNNARGVAGIAWNVKLMALKFLDDTGSGYTSDAIEAINYAVANGASISNNSWGGGGYSSSLYNAIVNARNQGHIVVAAAGNEGGNNDSLPSYPANYNVDNVVSVAATDRYDNLASFSNYGATTVDLAAPGVSILSTTPSNTYSYYSGTSMATPHVTGVLALVRSLHPTWSYSQLINQVLNNVDPVSGLSGKVRTGGRLNAAKALGQAPADTAGPRVTAAAWSGSSAGSVNRLRVTFSEAINVGTFTTADVASFTGPQGNLTVTGVSVVAGSGDRQFDLTFAAQTAAGTYRLVLGPTIADPAGNLMDQDADGTRGEATQDQFTATYSLSSAFTFTSNVAVTILDQKTVTASLAINQDVTIGDLNLTLDLTHTYDQDLILKLQAPWGTTVILANRRGGSGDNYRVTTFDDEAGTSVTAGAAPFNGSFRPEQLLSAFDGRNARGTWKLTIQDAARFDTGRLNSWSLRIEAAAGATGLSLPAAAPLTTPGGGSHPSDSEATSSASAADPVGAETLSRAGIPAESVGNLVALPNGSRGNVDLLPPGSAENAVQDSGTGEANAILVTSESASRPATDWLEWFRRGGGRRVAQRQAEDLFGSDDRVA